MTKQEILIVESIAIQNIPIDEIAYEKVTYLLKKCVDNGGKIVTSGIGKAGQVAHNLSTTFCSTGCPSVFLHPTEAAHGDLGILRKNDILLFFSNSGETEELVELYYLAKELIPSIFMILVTRNPTICLAEKAILVLHTGYTVEVCPLGLTPTTSTTVMSVIGDILVSELMQMRGFTAEDYYKRHHGGYLGKQSKNLIR
jgi:arabinose-5-phosphate isomerase